MYIEKTLPKKRLISHIILIDKNKEINKYISRIFFHKVQSCHYEYCCIIQLEIFIETLCNFFVVHCPIGSSPNDVVPLFYPSSQNTKITHFPKNFHESNLTEIFQKMYIHNPYLFCSSEIGSLVIFYRFTLFTLMPTLSELFS